MNLSRTLLLSTVLHLAASGYAVAQVRGFAEASAKVSISNFTYELIDLDMNDGITPSITFRTYDDDTSFSQLQVHSYVPDDYRISKVSDVNGTTALAPLTNSLHYLNTTSSPPDVSLSGQASIAGTLSEGLSMQTGLGLAATNRSTYSLHSNTSTGVVAFTLSPSSAIRFSMDVDVGASYDTSRMWNQAMDAGAAARFVTFRNFPEEEAFEIRDVWYSAREMGNGSLSESFDHLVENRLGTTTDNLFYLAATSWISLYPMIITSPVPEPVTYGMLLAGLGILQLAHRRRRNRINQSATLA